MRAAVDLLGVNEERLGFQRAGEVVVVLASSLHLQTSGHSKQGTLIAKFVVVAHAANRRAILAAERARADVATADGHVHVQQLVAVVHLVLIDLSAPHRAVGVDPAPLSSQLHRTLRQNRPQISKRIGRILTAARLDPPSFSIPA